MHGFNIIYVNQSLIYIHSVINIFKNYTGQQNRCTYSLILKDKFHNEMKLCLLSE